jgi:hypothetical protein
MTFSGLAAQLSVGMVTLGGWFGDINPILTGLGTLCGIAYYITQMIETWKGRKP